MPPSLYALPLPCAPRQGFHLGCRDRSKPTCRATLRVNWYHASLCSRPFVESQTYPPQRCRRTRIHTNRHRSPTTRRGIACQVEGLEMPLDRHRRDAASPRVLDDGNATRHRLSARLDAERIGDELTVEESNESLCLSAVQR